MAGKLPWPQPGCCASSYSSVAAQALPQQSCIASGGISGLTFHSSIKAKLQQGAGSQGWIVVCFENCCP